NGLDVPNANTLIVDGANRFGLAQLYQIRGRVGRSDRRAYCYLLVPEDLSKDAERRLKVLEHYTELGSGYSVAVRDLELRGAGNLLGADQSGFAQQVGLDAYMRLLRKTVKRIQDGEDAEGWPDPEISMDGAAYLPDDYVSDSSQKLHLHRRLSKMGSLAEIESLRLELADRFGQPPREVVRMLEGATLRVLGRSIGAERILVRGGSGRVSFRSDVVPKLASLEASLRGRSARLEVRRVQPLSVSFEEEGSGSVTETLSAALLALRDARSSVAA
ncbi:MAG TPA: TRCF domain-containing protein, partial [Longimicrobiales bacterium]|nr:TRCF domain-containing protein [Longimicrobiales bacterium]